jgi:hypothetical protein
VIETLADDRIVLYDKFPAPSAVAGGASRYLLHKMVPSA